MRVVIEIPNKTYLEIKGDYLSLDGKKAVCKGIKNGTPLQKGHWINTGAYYTGAYGSIDYVECSCCHYESLEEGDFCPNCGADMRGDNNDD